MIQALKEFAIGMGVVFPIAVLIATFDFWFPFVKSLG